MEKQVAATVAVAAVAEASRRKPSTCSAMKSDRCPANPISQLERDGVKRGKVGSGQKCSQETPLSRTCSGKKGVALWEVTQRDTSGDYRSWWPHAANKPEWTKWAVTLIQV